MSTTPEQNTFIGDLNQAACLAENANMPNLAARLRSQSARLSMRTIGEAIQPTPPDAMAKAIESLGDLFRIQTDAGTCTDEYVRGMANGLLLARSVLDGKDPQFVPAPASLVSPAPGPAEPTKDAFLSAMWEYARDYLGCTTGDCPHHLQTDCEAAMKVKAREIMEAYLGVEEPEAKPSPLARGIADLILDSLKTEPQAQPIPPEAGTTA